MNNFIDMFVRTVGDPTNVFALTDVFIVLGLTSVLTMLAGYVYKVTHVGVSYSRSFVVTLVLLGVIVSVIMLIIGSNIARAFTLVGALSIVRFRNAIKDTRDVAFIFFVMAIGMAVGTRFYLLSIIFTLFTLTLLYFLEVINFGKKDTSEQILKIIVNSKLNYQKKLTPKMMKYFDYCSLVRVNSVSGNSLELIYLGRVKRNIKSQELIAQLKSITKSKAVSILHSDHTRSV